MGRISDLRRRGLLSFSIPLLVVSLLLNIGTMPTAYGASSYFFESGFENEINNDFEGTIVTSGGTGAKLERATDVFYQGTRSLHVVAPPRDNSLQYAWTNFEHVTEVYSRFYVYFPDGSLFLYPDAWAGGKMEYWLYFLGGLAYLEPDGGEPRCNRTDWPLFTWGSLRLIYFEESVDRPEGYYFSGTTWSESGNRVYAPFNTPTPDAFPIETGRWYCLEVHHKMASGLGQNDGLAELWVDGNFDNGQYTSTPYLQAYDIANYEPEAPYYGAIEIGNREIPPSSTPETTPNLEIYIDSLKIDTQPIGPEPEEDLGVALKWALIVLGGYNYYERQEKNAIQRVEHWIQAQGVPYDLFSDDDIQAPTDTPSPGKYPLQYSNNNTRYQVLVIIANSYQDSSAVNVDYIYSAVQNGSNAVVFGTAIRMVPNLFGVSGSISTASGDFSCSILKTFDDGIQPYGQGDTINITNSYYRPTLSESSSNTVWFTMDSDVGMMNGTCGRGQVWYIGYTPNEFSMVEDPWYMSWEVNNWKLFAHAISFAFKSVQKIPVGIMPYKRWNGAIIHTTDVCHPQQDWMISALLSDAEEAAQKGWVYEAVFTVMGDGNNYYDLVDGFPSEYYGEPPNSGIKHTENGVLVNHLGNGYRKLILYVSGEHGSKYDKIKVDFNGDQDFSDEVPLGCWENITDPSWTRNGYQVTYMWLILDDRDFINPTKIGFVAWVSLESIDSQQQEQLRNLGTDYGWGYNFHGWLHHSYLGTTQDLGTYFRFIGNYSSSGFVADQAWLEQKFLEARDQMIAVFGGSGNGFDANFMGNADPGGVNRPKEARDIMEKYMKWKRTPAVVDLPAGGYYDIGARDAGWFLPEGKIPIMLADVATEVIHGSATTLECFSVFIDMARTLYPVVPIHQHIKYYEPSINFTPYSDMPGMANAKDSLIFWTEAKNMLMSTKGYYFNNKIVLEFDANPNLTEFVWKFPSEYAGKYFKSFFDNCTVGRVVRTDGESIYVEFDQGAGAHRIEVSYGTTGNGVPHQCSLMFASSPINDVSITVDGATHTTPYTANYACESTLSITAPSSVSSEGVTYTFDHWADDQGFSSYSGSTSYTVPSTSLAILTAYYISAEDSIPPTIAHTPITTGNEGQAITIAATITDNFAVAEATLYYRETGETVYTSVTMIKFGDTFRGTIPASVVTIVGVQYYINASDGLNFATDPATNPTTSPHTITIGAENLPPTAVALNEPSDITEDSMKLAWTPNSDADFVAYEIYQSTSPGTIGTKIHAITDRSTASYTITGLSPKTTYYFTIRVLDAGGLTTDSNQVSGKTVSSPTNEGTGWISVLVAAVVVVTAALITIFTIRKKRG